jgi:two-component system LytT family response regulator
VIVDDEPLARGRLTRLLARDPEIVLVAECGDGREAIHVLLHNQVDLLFLDVQMPEMNGFQVLRALPEQRMPVVVFVTAYDRYAIEAFDVGGIDYLLKPFHHDRLAKSLARAKAQASPQKPVDPSPARPTQLVMRSGRAVVLLNFSEIDWIEAANNYVCVHCGPAEHIARETLASLETRLPYRRFVRIHRSVIVNAARVRTIHPLPNGDRRVLLQDGTHLVLSRTFRDNLQRLTSSSA